MFCFLCYYLPYFILTRYLKQEILMVKKVTFNLKHFVQQDSK